MTKYINLSGWIVGILSYLAVVKLLVIPGYEHNSNNHWTKCWHIKPSCFEKFSFWYVFIKLLDLSEPLCMDWGNKFSWVSKYFSGCWIINVDPGGIREVQRIAIQEKLTQGGFVLEDAVNVNRNLSGTHGNYNVCEHGLHIMWTVYAMYAFLCASQHLCTWGARSIQLHFKCIALHHMCNVHVCKCA